MFFWYPCVWKADHVLLALATFGCQLAREEAGPCYSAVSNLHPFTSASVKDGDPNPSESGRRPSQDKYRSSHQWSGDNYAVSISRVQHLFAELVKRVHDKLWDAGRPNRCANAASISRLAVKLLTFCYFFCFALPCHKAMTLVLFGTVIS